MSSILITKYIQSPATGSIVLLRHEKKNNSLLTLNATNTAQQLKGSKKLRKYQWFLCQGPPKQCCASPPATEKVQDQILALLTSGRLAIALTAGPSFRATGSDSDSSSYPQRIDKLPLKSSMNLKNNTYMLFSFLAFQVHGKVPFIIQHGN